MSDSIFSDSLLFSFGETPSSSSGISDKGRVRESNQDQFMIAQLNKSMMVGQTSLPVEDRLFGGEQAEVLLVADGMGGHAAGEKASQLAIGHLVHRLLDSVRWIFDGGRQDSEREEEFIEDLKDALKDVHAKLLLEGNRNSSHFGMGTTLTMGLLIWPRLYVVHAGDSRCYLIRDGEAEQLTTDHTLARQMVESGGLKPEDEADSKWSNVLWNVLGGGRTDGEFIAEVRRVVLEPGDSIVLCSDGLHRYVDREKLGSMVSNAESTEDACKVLVALANQSGGEDNITVVVSRPESEDGGRTTWVDDFDTVVP